MNAFTSPTELISAMMSGSSPSSPTGNSTTNTLQQLQLKQQQKTEQQQQSGGPKLHERVSFKLTGIEMAIPYAVTVVSEVTADPVGAEKAAKLVVRDVFDNVARKHLSQFEPSSEISKINESIDSSDWIPLSSTLGSVLRAAEIAAHCTNNVFAPVVSQSADQEQPRRSLVFSEHFELQQEKGCCQFRLRRKQPRSAAQLDVCGIAKGWIVDTMTCRLLAAGFSGVLVDWGGDMKAVGLTPAPLSSSNDDDDGSGWRVGVVKPKEVKESSGVDSIELRDAACATSGNFMQSQPHIRSGVDGAAYAKSAVVASVTVVHPSAATADALSTFIFCALTSPAQDATVVVDESARLDAICHGLVTDHASAIGFEMQRAVLQLYTGEDKKTAVRFIHWENPMKSLPEIALRPPAVAGIAGATAMQSTDALAKLRRSMRRTVAAVFVRLLGDQAGYFGATLSSGGLMALLSTQPTLSSTPPGKLFSSATLPKGITSCAFVFSAIRASRLFNLLASTAAVQSSSSSSCSSNIYIFLPRIGTSIATSAEAESQHQSLVAQLNSFAGGATVTNEEMDQLIMSGGGSIVAPCTLLSAPGIAPVVAGTHGVFALRVHIEKNDADIRSVLSSSMPVIRAGRGYAVSAPPTASQLAAPQLYPGGPTTCAVATRLAKGQFFGCTVQHVEFVSIASDPAAPVLQFVVPVHALSLAAFENFNLAPPTTSVQVKLHFFSDHDDAVSLLSWFSDPSFMTGSRSEHFLYLPSAATPEEELGYEFPGTAGRAGALYTVVCDVLHVSNLTLLPGGAGAPACLILAQARSGGAKMLVTEGSKGVGAAHQQPGLAWA